MVADLSAFNLSEKCIMLCTSAKSVLENMCTLIRTGNITLADLSQMKEKIDHVNKLLCEAVSLDDLKVLQQLLEQRFLEQRRFTERLDNLKQICQNINIRIKGT